MNKKTLILICNLNQLYDSIWNIWRNTKKDSFEFNELNSKMKLIWVITKNIEEQQRWFLKSKVDYISGWEYILKNFWKKFEDLHKEVSEILLW